MAHVEDIVTVLSDAFHDYPVMRYVLGPRPRYDDRLPVLISLFVSARAFRNEPMLGIRESGGRLIAAALMTLPDSSDPPPAFLAKRESVWRELGDDARARYDDFITAWTATAMESPPHHQLNMIGVCRAYQGRGFSRALLEAVHDLASSDAGSAGVSLTTEHASNLALYEHFGYRVHGRTRVAEALETWTLFRPMR